MCCCSQEHEAWLDEPQELANMEAGKIAPLLEERKDGKQADVLLDRKSDVDVTSRFDEMKVAADHKKEEV